MINMRALRALCNFNEKVSALEALDAWFKSVSHAFLSFIRLIEGLSSGLDVKAVQNSQRFDALIDVHESIIPFLNSPSNFFKDQQVHSGLEKLVQNLQFGHEKELNSINAVSFLIKEMKDVEKSFRETQTRLTNRNVVRMAFEQTKGLTSIFKEFSYKISSCQKECNKGFSAMDEKFDQIIWESKENEAAILRGKKPPYCLLDRVLILFDLVEKNEKLITDYLLIFVQRFETARFLETARYEALKIGFCEIESSMSNLVGKNKFVESAASLNSILSNEIAEESVSLKTLVRPIDQPTLESICQFKEQTTEALIRGLKQINYKIAFEFLSQQFMLRTYPVKCFTGNDIFDGSVYFTTDFHVYVRPAKLETDKELGLIVRAPIALTSIVKEEDNLRMNLKIVKGMFWSTTQKVDLELKIIEKKKMKITPLHF